MAGEAKMATGKEVAHSPLRAKMQIRLRALARKALPHVLEAELSAIGKKSGQVDLKSPENEAIVDGLVEILLSHVHRKKEYESLFASEEAVEASIKRWKLKLTGMQNQLIFEMQRRKDIFTPLPWLDHLLTAFFIAEVVTLCLDLNSKSMLLAFGLALLLADCFVSRVKTVSASIGGAISQWIHSKGCTDGDTHPLSGPVQMKKWKDQCWQLAIHAGFAMAEGYILTQDHIGGSWWEKPNLCWDPHPYVQGEQHLAVRLVYLGQLAIWVYTCLVHRFFDERRRDYFVLYVHHIATIGLVGLSFHAGYLRIGVLVLWVHDVSDIFIDILKIVNYLKLEGPKGFFASEIVYASTIVSWIYWRLYQYPFRVINAALVVSYRLHGPPLPNFLSLSEVSTWFGIMYKDMFLYLENNVLLVLLQILHLYWFFLLAMVGYRILRESAREASRQEYEGDSDIDDDDDELTTAVETKARPALMESASMTSKGSGSHATLKKRK